MTFTKSELEIIKHRMNAATIPEVLMDDDNPKWTDAQCWDAFESVQNRLNTGRWDGLSDCEKDVLADTIEGSTWAGIHHDMEHDGVITRQRFIAVLKRMEALGEKIAELTDREIHVPQG